MITWISCIISCFFFRDSFLFLTTISISSHKKVMVCSRKRIFPCTSISIVSLSLIRLWILSSNVPKRLVILALATWCQYSRRKNKLSSLEWDFTVKIKVVLIAICWLPSRIEFINQFNRVVCVSHGIAHIIHICDLNDKIIFSMVL